MFPLYIIRVNWEESCPRVSKKPVFERLSGQNWSQSWPCYCWLSGFFTAQPPQAFCSLGRALCFHGTQQWVTATLKSPRQTVIFLSLDLSVLSWLQFLLCLQIHIQALSRLLIFLMNCAAGALTTDCCLGGGITAGHLSCACNDRAWHSKLGFIQSLEGGREWILAFKLQPWCQIF